MKVAGRRPGGSGGVAAGGGDGEARRSLVFASARLSRDAGLGVLGALLPCPEIPAAPSPLGMSLFGPFPCAGAAPPPCFALKRSEPVQLRPLPGSARSALSFGSSRAKVEVRFSTLGVSGSARLWEKPPGGILAAERAACLGKGRGIGVCRGQEGSRRGRGCVRGALGWEGRPAGTNLWHGGLCASTCGSHRQPGWPV